MSGSRVIAGLTGVVPSCHRAFVGVPCVLNVFSWVFREFDKLKRLITQFEYTKSLSTLNLQSRTMELLKLNEISF